MPTYYARKAGNINATDVWATTPSGTAAAVTFASGDILMANSFTITVNVSTNIGSGEVRTDTFGGATAGGRFDLANGVTLTANVYVSGAPTFGGMQLTGTNSATIVGNVFGLPNANTTGIYHSSTGALNIVGNLTNAAASGANTLRLQGSNQTLNVTGSVLGTANGSGETINLQSDFITFGSFNFTGNITGGFAAAISSSYNNVINVTGNVQGGNVGVGIASSAASSLITINGSVIAGSNASGLTNSSTSTIRATRAVGNAYGPGNVAGLSARVGIANTGLGIVEIEQLEYGTFGQSPISGTGIRLKKANTNVAVFNFCDTAGAKTLVDATQGQMPDASNVRSGVSYASGALVGTCAVPAAGSVALGVPVDNTTGTAILTGGAVATAVWGAASRTITGGLVDTATTLTNAPTVPSAAQIASQVRTELATELARVDVATSSRLAAADYNAPTSAPTAASVANAVWSAAARTITGGTVDTLTNAPTVPSAAAIAAQVWAVADKTGYSLTSAERSAIAAAVEASLLNEGDGQAILNAIVTAIGNSNVDQVALVAAIRSDLERNGGNISAIKAKTDALPASPAATGDIPSANIAAIKAKTDLLNTDRLAQVSTVSTTGAQLAAALS